MSHSHHNSSFNGTPWFITECTIHLDEDYRRITLFLLYLVIFLVGLAENALVVWVNWHRRHSANGVLFCVMNVSMSDLLVVLILPFFMLEVSLNEVWLWGRFLCIVTNLIYVVNFYSSSIFLAFMTLERYLSLAWPSSPACFPVGARRRWLLCGGLWLLSLSMGLLETAHVDLLEWDEPGCYMMPEYSYMEWFISVSFLGLIFQFLGPTVVIVTCNLLIARAVHRAPDVQGRREVWLVHVYSLVFVVCWLPYHVVTFLMMLDDMEPLLLSCNAVEVLYFSFSVVQCLSLFHCVANPILYNFLSKSFRTNLINHVVQYMPREDLGEGAEAGARGTGAGRVPKLSNMSTSDSNVVSLTDKQTQEAQTQQ
ncbi:G-protein coupled receptor 182 [Hypomesus transpacificus]|uniref:G-protein coupled receptor 182 n=1 Tax=Hypomesus transpacificus TaxID=137520 RepID=UPI001F08540B|nr:G-protein coupled receptor 182 [Hypomesus transpacificus]